MISILRLIFLRAFIAFIICISLKKTQNSNPNSILILKTCVQKIFMHNYIIFISNPPSPLLFYSDIYWFFLSTNNVALNHNWNGFFCTFVSTHFVMLHPSHVLYFNWNYDMNVCSTRVGNNKIHHKLHTMHYDYDSAKHQVAFIAKLKCVYPLKVHRSFNQTQTSTKWPKVGENLNSIKMKNDRKNTWQSLFKFSIQTQIYTSSPFCSFEM